ncbi:MAG: cob(I)yrinic acid a,c-diamide adenosyltransferase [Candidatus Paceibacterota bacterium]|jgi:cob(I)alamin adenosyltransferase
MLYTKKGDDGKTNIFGCDQRLSKSSAIAEALGCLDEINSYLGVIKAKINDKENKELIHAIQNNLFIIQAEVAGADKKINEREVKNLEKIINNIEKELSPIKSFLISGANEISADFDFARTLARRAERRVVAVSDEGITKIDTETLVYLNRLSSLLYALARQSAKESGEEIAPKY